MKTRFENLALLDMTTATPEAVEAIDSIGNAALVLVSTDTKPLLPKIKFDNLAMVIELPSGVRPSMHNGHYTMGAESMAAPFYFIVNGHMTVAPEVLPDDILAKMKGGMVNGHLLCSSSQLAAMEACGLKVNGKSTVYPDGAMLREGHEPLAMWEAESLTKPLFLTHSIVIEKGVLEVLAAKGMHLFGKDGAIVEKSDARDFHQIWKGSGSILYLPEGFSLHEGTLDVNPRNAYVVKGKRYVTKDLIIRETAPGDVLKNLQAIHIGGKVLVPTHMLPQLMEKLVNEPELLPYDGALIMIEGDYSLTSDILANLPPVISLYSIGVIHIDPAIPGETLKGRIAMLFNKGVVNMTPAQQGALYDVLINEGVVNHDEGGDEEEETKEEPAAINPDLNVIDNTAYFVL